MNSSNNISSHDLIQIKSQRLEFITDNAESQKILNEEIEKILSKDVTEFGKISCPIKVASDLKRRTFKSKPFFESNVVNSFIRHFVPSIGNQITGYENNLSEMYRALNILYISEAIKSDPKLIESYKSKQIFANKCSNFEKRQQIIKQLHLPLIKAAINQLAKLYEEWDNTDANKDLIRIQHRNLEALSDILHELRSHPVMELTLLDESIRNVLNKYLVQNVIIDDNEKFQLKIFLEEKLKTFQKRPSITSKELHALRKHAPVSINSIHMQNDLFIQSRRAASVVANMITSQFSPQVVSSNQVYKICNPAPLSLSTSQQEIIAYYKEGKDGEQASAIMEELIWQISVILGLERQFTPTKRISLRTKENSNAQGDSAVYYNDKGELARLTGLSKERQGVIQIAEKGTRLLELYYARTLNQISSRELIKGMLTLLTLGMFDAHYENIILDNSGRLLFFDNTRSMPPSSLIYSVDRLQPSIRSVLLYLDESYRPFTATEYDFINKYFNLIDSKLWNLHKFLKDPLIVSKLKKLPPGWFDSESSLTEFELRLERMKSAIQSKKATTLQELAFETIPDTKFFAALQMLDVHSQFPGMSFDYLEKDAMSRVGYSGLKSLLEVSTKYGIDAKKVQDWCEDKDLKLQDIYQKMLDMHKNCAQADSIKIQDNNNEILNQYYIKAKIDFKDAKSDSIPGDTRFLIGAQFNALNCEFFGSTTNQQQIDEAVVRMPLKSFIVQSNSSSTPKDMILINKDKKGVIGKYQLDYLTKPGYLRITHHLSQEFYTPEELLALFD